MAQVLILARLCHPSSELHIAEHFYEASALSDLLGVPADKVNEHRLYRALDQLLRHKEGLEKHLKHRLGELFELDYDLLFYDVTSVELKIRRPVPRQKAIRAENARFPTRIHFM